MTRLLLTHDSFLPDVKSISPSDTTRRLGGSPLLTSTLLTTSFYVGVLFVLERLAVLFIEHYLTDPVSRPYFEDPLGRAILARHIAVDFVCCAAVVYLGLSKEGLDVCRPLLRKASPFAESISIKGHEGNKKNDDVIDDDDGGWDDDADGGYAERVFGYRPCGHRILLLFFAYQVKNMYDTIYWNDGLPFVMHHVFAGGAAWAGMYPGCCHHYSVFYMGISEISTAILCLLANFDDEHGVPGLGEVLPLTKAVLGIVFTISFAICRVYMWPIVTKQFHKDAMRAAKCGDGRAEGRRVSLRMIHGCLMGLSVIQVFFLYEIYRNGKNEYKNIMAAMGLGEL